MRVRSAQHYQLWRLQDDASADAPLRKLSPAALWILLAYLPPEVRRRPWVRHLVEQQLARPLPTRPTERMTPPAAGASGASSLSAAAR